MLDESLGIEADFLAIRRRLCTLLAADLGDDAGKVRGVCVMKNSASGLWEVLVDVGWDIVLQNRVLAVLAGADDAFLGLPVAVVLSCPDEVSNSIPRRRPFPDGTAQCDLCGGHGCVNCDFAGWVSEGDHAARRCNYSGCGKVIVPDREAIYCSRRCAERDA